ncbi:MAG: glycosyltransferase [Candidatus Hydrogenedentes bacterium]|nr:glycosyltransferase [Candidatus Hydrogenedentota bacterium]
MADAVGSLAAQTYAHWECILVNDGSTDATAEVALQLCEADFRVRCIDQANRGLAGARNTGLNAARGAYIQFLDADDLLFPQKFELQLAALRQVDEPGVAYCRPFFCLGNDTKTEISSRRPFPLIDTEAPLLDLALRWEKGLSIPCHTYLFDARLFRNRHVRFDESLPNHEDWDCWMRIFAQHPKVVFIDQKLAVYRRHEVSMCRDEALMRRGWIMALRKQLEEQRDNPVVRWTLSQRIAHLEQTDAPEPPLELSLRPLVSVVLTSYNYAAFVGESIRSVFQQTYKNIELIVVDDGSTDNSREVIEEAIKDAPIPVRTLFKENGGQSSACNAGFALVQGEVISFLDSDDFWYSDRVEKVLDFMRLLPGGGLYQHQLETGKGLKRNGMAVGDVFRLWKQWGDGRFNLADDHDGVLFSPFQPTSGLTFRKVILDKVMPIPDALVTCPDAYLTRTSCAYGPLRSLDLTLGVWRDHGENAGRSATTSFSSYWLPVIMPALNDYYKQHKLGLELYFDPKRRSASPAARILGEGYNAGQGAQSAAQGPAKAVAPAPGSPPAAAPVKAAAPAPLRRTRVVSMRTGHRLANMLRSFLPETTVQRIRAFLRKDLPIL